MEKEMRRRTPRFSLGGMGTLLLGQGGCDGCVHCGERAVGGISALAGPRLPSHLI